MSNPFAPNRRGLVVVTLLKNYASNVAGEKAGFLPEIAKELVKKGYASLHGFEPPAEKAKPEEGPELTSRKFQPAKQPEDEVVPGSATDALRQEYRDVTGKEPDARWGASRLATEIERAKADKPAETKADE